MSTSGNIKISQLIARKTINGKEIVPISYSVADNGKYESYSTTFGDLIDHIDVTLGNGESMRQKGVNLSSYIDALEGDMDKVMSYSYDVGNRVGLLEDTIGGTSGESLIKKIDNALGYIDALEDDTQYIKSYAYSLDSRVDQIEETIGGTSGESLVKKIDNALSYIDALEDDIDTKQDKCQFFNNIEASNWTSSENYNGFIYKCDITIAGVTAEDFVEIIFGIEEATSGMYAPICESYDGTVRIYSNSNETITIPTIIATRKN